MNNEELEKAQEYLKKNVAGLLEKMTVDLLLEKPEDVVQFMQDWIRTKGESVK